MAWRQTERHMDSRKLIRCTVVNRDGVASVRFVELEYFRLWEYMMSHKHGLKVRDISLSLWVTAEDFTRRNGIYLSAGEVENVNRFVVSVFDEANGYSHTVSRYAVARETEAMRSALLSHVPNDLQNSDRFELSVHPGFCIEREKTPDLNRFVLGLSHV